MLGSQLVASVIAYQMVQEWVREGEAQRRSGSLRAAHARKPRFRRFGHGLAQGALAPVRVLHTQHEAPQVGGPRMAA